MRTDSLWLECHFHIRPTLTALDSEQFVGSGPEVPRLDVVCDGELRTTVELDERASSVRIADLPAGTKELELWLPHLHQFQLRGLRLAPGSLAAAPDVPPGRPWVHYGSSICQGRGAGSPSTAWPAIVARETGRDLTSLAFGAGCHLQPMFARLIRSLPAELITCMVGHNDLAVGGIHNFPANLLGFIKIIREGHPSTPLVVISPILLPWWEEPPEPGAESMPPYRTQAEKVVELLRDHGDTELHYVNGLDVFGEYREDIFHEPSFWGVHPSAIGHRLLADNLMPILGGLENDAPGPGPR